MKRSCRCWMISAGLLPSNSDNARATASPVAFMICSRSRWAPPTGSVMITSMTPNWSRSWAVIFMLVAASIALAESRHRMDAGGSGDRMREHQEAVCAGEGNGAARAALADHDRDQGHADAQATIGRPRDR